MTAPNHALTGALIGLSIASPAAALPLAFLSHFVCDAIPHYDPPGSSAEIYRSKRFIGEFLVLGALLCFVIVLLLAATRPLHWVIAAWCAFLATSPDLFQIKYFLYTRRTGHDHDRPDPLKRFHSWIQWKTGPRLRWVELAWFVVFGGMFITRIWK